MVSRKFCSKKKIGEVLYPNSKTTDKTNKFHEKVQQKKNGTRSVDFFYHPYG